MNLKEYVKKNIKYYLGDSPELVKAIEHYTPEEMEKLKKRKKAYEKRSDEINKSIDQNKEMPPASYEDYKKEFK